MNKSFEELKATDRLPSPPGIVMELLRLSREEGTSAEDIARVVQPDPALTGRILHMANAAGAGGQTAVTTVAEAAVRLGMNSISAIALGFSLVGGNRRGRCEAFAYDRFWARSLARAVVFQRLARQLRCGDPNEMFVCGLVGEIGQLALVTVHPTRYAALLGDHTGRDLLEAEQEAFGIDHRETTTCLLEDWGLPARFLEAVGGSWIQPDPDAPRLGVGALAHVGTQIANGLVQSAPLADRESIDAALERFQRWDPGTLDALLDETMRDWHHWGTLMEVPTQPSPPEDEPDPPRTEAAPAALRILAVDDDPTTLKVLEMHLSGAGYQVLTAHGGREALRLAVENEPHLVVADWRMPDMDGVELCRALRTYEAGEQTYVILVTGETEEERILEAFEAGIDDYVSKPYRPRLLLARVAAGCRVIQLQHRIERDKITMESQVAELGILTRNLEMASLTDPLTSLPNRRHGLAVLEQLWQSGLRERQPLATLMIDIDHFKRFNDEHGHDVGDAVLVQVTRALQSVARGSDLLFRFGGEEFCMVLGQSTLEDALTCGERLRAAVEGATLSSGTFTGSATVSVGAAERAVGMDRPEDLLKAADEALYRAKDAGRNQVCAGPARVPA